jgi:threonine dehydrogenase-like Zn-dependent dehydrogenase
MRRWALVSAGRIRPEAVITHHFGLTDAAAGYAALASREAIKVVLTTDGQS